MTRLPRLANRALHAWQAHREADVALEAQGATMAVAAERFTASQALHEEREARATEARQQCQAAVHALRLVKRRCIAAVQRDIPNFDTTGLNDSTVPEDAIAQARDLAKRMAPRTGDGEPLPHMEALLAGLTDAVVFTEEAVTAVHEANTLAQQASDARRAAAVLLDDKLIAFRAILRSVVGKKHRDYRQLRARTAHEELEDDLELDPPEAEVDEPPPQPVTEAEGRPPVARSATNGTG